MSGNGWIDCKEYSIKTASPNSFWFRMNMTIACHRISKSGDVYPLNNRTKGKAMSSLRTNNPGKSWAPIVVGVIALGCYLVFIASSWSWEEGWIIGLLQEHYVFFVGLPFAGFLAYFVVGTLENVRGQIEFEILGMKFKGASGPIVMWVVVFLAIVVAMRLVWPLQ